MDSSFWDSNGDEISAAITIAVAVLLALGVDRFLLGRAERATQSMDTAVFSREARTRLRLIRRLVFLTIILVGVALALSQFTSIRRLATGVLASTAVLGVIIGFAGRQVIANFVAGVVIAVTQPVRIGDLVTVAEDRTGRVVDIALTYTRIDSGDGRLLVVPNEMLLGDVVVNHSAANLKAPVAASIWVPPATDIEAARRALEAVGATSVRLAEATVEGARIELRAPIGQERDRSAAEDALRERAQAALRGAGLQFPLGPPG
jgi:small-conductance mechanosensitive channel